MPSIDGLAQDATSAIDTATALSGSDGGRDTPNAPSTSNRLIATTVSGYAHAVDIYATAGATRAIVLLHGGGGNQSAIAFQVGLNSSATNTSMSTINWAWLEANHVMLVVPQGQNIASEPNATTWANYAMNSGQNDKAFLQALAARLHSDYRLTNLTLMGHSMGGVMTNRMWCESNASFDAYVSLAGPASSAFNQAGTPCSPGTSASRYMGIIGDADQIMQTSGEWASATWRVNPVVVRASAHAWDNDVVIGEFHQQQARTQQVCGGSLASNDYTSAGLVDTWLSCGGRLVLKRVRGADHGVVSIDAQMGSASNLDVMNTVIEFISAL